MQRVQPKHQQSFIVRFLKGIKGTDPIILEPIPQIAFIGRSNAGKSSTINALLSQPVAKTSARPGKTLEINLFRVETLGKQFLVCDLPGYGWSLLSEKGRQKLRKHILWYLAESGAKPTVALVVDAMVPPTDFDLEAARVCETEKHPYVIIANKCDRLNQKERALTMKRLSEAFPGAKIFPHSAKSGEGKSEVRAALGLV